MRLTPTIRLIPALAVLTALTAGAVIGSPLLARASTPATAPRSTLADGDALASGQVLTSPNRSYAATMQSDGNLVIRNAQGSALWATGTSGYPKAAAAVGSDGDLVISSTDHVARWSSTTAGNSADHVSMGNNGVLTVLSRGGLTLWASPAGRTGYTTASLPRSGVLAAGQSAWTADGRYALVQQTDGNLVLRSEPNGAALWSTGTTGHGAGSTTLQSDGNLVLRTADGAARWSSGTSGSGATSLTVQTDGNLVLRAGSAAVWTRTSGKVAATGSGAAVVAKAASMKGLPYCWAGGSTGGPTHGQGGSGCGGSTVGFDCSGLAMYALYQALHITLPHYSGGQATAGGTKIASLAALQPGDLAFFGGGSAANSTHVAIYAGNGTFWDAATYGIPVGTRTTSWETNSAAFDGGVRYWH